MIRLNVYYPTRTITLLLCEAGIVYGCFLAATWWRLGPDRYIALHYQQGLLKIALITLLTLFVLLLRPLRTQRNRLCPVANLLPYPSGAGPRLLYRLRLPHLRSRRSHRPVRLCPRLRPAGALLSTAAQGTSGSGVINCFASGYTSLGPESARSIVEAIRAHPDIGMEVVFWEDVQLEAAAQAVVDLSS